MKTQKKIRVFLGIFKPALLPQSSEEEKRSNASDQRVP